MAPTIRWFRPPTRKPFLRLPVGPGSCGSRPGRATRPRWPPTLCNTAGASVLFCGAIWACPGEPPGRISADAGASRRSHDARLFQIARQRPLHHLEQIVDIPRPVIVYDLVPEDVPVAQQAIALGAEDLTVDFRRLVAGQIDNDRRH